ncbi:hypothetical protein G5I_07024 [Acromyrmex echinatior]|uniref:Uncharacterized protein n=1 Tax=Acromyrmex echinatior TaxID=103372 RepID=F4WMP0_ACREC|nr:hypothetical protein G5I_07024 [Acromyrmex echinatior]
MSSRLAFLRSGENPHLLPPSPPPPSSRHPTVPRAYTIVNSRVGPLSFTYTRTIVRWISLNYGYATSGDNDKGSEREVRKYNYGVAYRRPGDQAVITRTAELNTCGVVNSPFSRAAIDRSINLRTPVAIRRLLYTMLAICGADQEWRMVAG